MIVLAGITIVLKDVLTLIETTVVGTNEVVVCVGPETVSVTGTLMVDKPMLVDVMVVRDPEIDVVVMNVSVILEVTCETAVETVVWVTVVGTGTLIVEDTTLVEVMVVRDPEIEVVVVNDAVDTVVVREIEVDTVVWVMVVGLTEIRVVGTVTG